MCDNPEPSYEGLPSPPVPADCDLRGFEFMPLWVERMRKSRTWLGIRQKPELAFPYVNLLTAAWQSFPAASLEDDDLVLADAAMCDLGKWLEMRSEIMRGWILCNDGRWYHPFLAERAQAAWLTRVAHRKRLAKARVAKAVKKAAASQPLFQPRTRRARPSPVASPSPVSEARCDQSDEADVSPPQNLPRPSLSPIPTQPLNAYESDAVTDGVVEVIPPSSQQVQYQQESANSSVIDLKWRGESISREKKGSLRSPSARARTRESVFAPDPFFERFMEAYPVSEGPRAARIQWDAALGRGHDPANILEGLARHRFADNPRYIKHPANWLAADCWLSPGVVREPLRNGFLELVRREGMPSVDAGLTPSKSFLESLNV